MYFHIPFRNVTYWPYILQQLTNTLFLSITTKWVLSMNKVKYRPTASFQSENVLNPFSTSLCLSNLLLKGLAALDRPIRISTLLWPEISWILNLFFLFFTIWALKHISTPRTFGTLFCPKPTDIVLGIVSLSTVWIRISGCVLHCLSSTALRPVNPTGTSSVPSYSILYSHKDWNLFAVLSQNSYTATEQTASLRHLYLQFT